MTTRRIVAVTGGTGFLGRWVVCALAAAGWRPRLLVRRDPVHPQLTGIDYEIVPGDLDDTEALRRLVQGATAIVHVAGAIKALSRRAYFDANVDATARLARIAATEVPGSRFVYVSSLAAREPGLSDYAASKAAAEDAVRELGPADWTAVRAAAVYGPWDRETLAIFRAASGRLMPLPGQNGARVCLVHASDAAAAVAALSGAGPAGRIYEVSDARHEGYAWATIAFEAVRSVEGNARDIRIPPLALRAAGIVLGVAAAIRRKPVMLTSGKVREILHPDWSSARERQPPPELWLPSIDLAAGFAETARWYRLNGWLAAGASRDL